MCGHRLLHLKEVGCVAVLGGLNHNAVVCFKHKNKRAQLPAGMRTSVSYLVPGYYSAAITLESLFEEEHTVPVEHAECPFEQQRGMLQK